MLILEDILIAARTVRGEAGGESYAGMKAVAHVLINRWKSTTGQWAKDDTLATTCLRHYQFTSWNKGDPNFERITTVGVELDNFRLCLRAVLEALDEKDFQDLTRGSRHYHTNDPPSPHAEWPPGWAKGHKPVYRVGNHVFYNDVP